MGNRVLVLGMVLVLGCGVSAAAVRGSTPGPQGGLPPGASDSVKVEPVLDARQKTMLKKEMQVVGAVEMPGMRTWERKKSAKVAVLCNMMLPGLGELYNGRRLKTALMVGLSTYYIGSIWTEHKQAVAKKNLRDRAPVGSLEWKQHDLFYQFHKENSLDYAWWSGALWLIGVLDAFADAHLFDVRSVNPTVVQSSSQTQYLALSVSF